MKKTILATIVVFAFIACETQLEEEAHQVEETTPTEEEFQLEEEEQIPEFTWEKKDIGAEEYYPEISVYSSEDATLKGWIEEKEVFGTDEMQSMFRVADEDLNKLPETYKDEAFYEVDDETLEFLQGYDGDNPASVLVVEIRSSWEGAPQMKVVPIK